jgi:hypothetical protein
MVVIEVLVGSIVLLEKTSQLQGYGPLSQEKNYVQNPDTFTGTLLS